jgi:hypothetical protein
VSISTATADLAAVPQEAVRPVHDAEEVHGNDRSCRHRRDVAQLHDRTQHAGVVDPEIDRPEAVDDPRREVLDRSGVCDVDDGSDARRLRRRELDVRAGADADRRTEVGESSCAPGPESTAGACDHHHPSCERLLPG